MTKYDMSKDTIPAEELKFISAVRHDAESIETRSWNGLTPEKAAARLSELRASVLEYAEYIRKIGAP